jgi:hypothetical protein
VNFFNKTRRSDEHDDTMNDNDNKAKKLKAMQGVSVVQEILRRWNPIGQSVPADEYDGYAPHIVSMVTQGCSLDELCSYLGEIRDDMGMGPLRSSDREVGDEILQVLRATRPT